MDRFIEFCVDTFIREADQYGTKPQMLKAFKEESDEQLALRIGSVMDNLEMAYAMQGNVLMICSPSENVQAVVAGIKEKLAAELARA